MSWLPNNGPSRLNLIFEYSHEHHENGNEILTHIRRWLWHSKTIMKWHCSKSTQIFIFSVVLFPQFKCDGWLNDNSKNKEKKKQMMNNKKHFQPSPRKQMFVYIYTSWCRCIHYSLTEGFYAELFKCRKSDNFLCSKLA